MKYRIQIDIMLDKEKEAIDLLNIIEQIKGRIYKPTGKEIIVCKRKGEYHKCYHDEIPPKPCEDYIAIDFDKPKIIRT